MKYVILTIILAVLKESHPLAPEILKYGEYMKDFEATGRRIKEEGQDKIIDGLIMKRESTSKWPKTGDVMKECLDLLNKQKAHHQQIDELFKKMCAKNKKHEHYELLVRSCGGKLEFCDELITNNTKIVQAYIKKGSASDDFKKEPLSYVASRELTDCWKHIDDYNTNYAPQFDLDVNAEIEAMREPLASAIAEIEGYSKYLDDLYEESGKNRTEHIYFLYPKYGKHKRAPN